MSTAAISYGSLKDASNEAKSVAKKLDAYANSVESSIYKKLNNYSGDWTGNITSARNSANTKIQALRSTADRYEKYAENLIGLRDQCKNVDTAVKNKVSSLTTSFKENHGIRNSVVENALGYFFTSVGNSTNAGRWLNDKADEVGIARTYIKDSIKQWFNYEGGKELLKGVLIGLLEVAIGVLAVVGAILSGGALLVIIAGVVGGIIAAANGIANIVNEGRAYSATQNDDPATGRRLSEENTIQDVLRDGDITDEENKGWLNRHVKISRGIAFGIDAVNLACTVITFVSSAGKLLKNGYKWATGVGSNTKNIQMRQILSEGKFKEIFCGAKAKIASGLTDIKCAFKAKDGAYFINVARDFGSDFLNNLKGEYLDFGSLKDGISSTKGILGVVKNIVSDGITFENIMDDIILPGSTVFSVDKIGYTDGITNYIERDTIAADKFTGLFEKSGKITNATVSLTEVLSELLTPSDINISVPDIAVPQIVMPEIQIPDIKSAFAA